MQTNVAHKHAATSRGTEKGAWAMVFRTDRGATMTLVPKDADVIELLFARVRQREARPEAVWFFAIDAKVRSLFLLASLTHIAV